MTPMPCDKKGFVTSGQADKFAKWCMDHKGWKSKKMRGYKCPNCIRFHVSSEAKSKDNNKTLDAAKKKKRRQKDRLNSRKARQ